MPPSLIATLAAGLRYDSRILQKMSGAKIEEDRLVLFSILDAINLLIWQNTEDGHKNRNRPASFVQAINEREKKKNMRVFNSAQDFEQYRQARFRRNEEVKADG